MARGLPDYKSSNSQYSQSITDIAELAARLGSRDVLDRRGSVIYIEDWNNLLGNWEVFLDGVSAVDIVNFRCYMGDKVLRVTPDTNPANEAELVRYIPMFDAHPIGLELMWMSNYNHVNPPSKFRIYMIHYTGTSGVKFNLTVDPSTDHLTILAGPTTPGTDIVILPSVGQLWQGVATIDYNFMKLIIDPSTDYYVRGVLNGQGFDLTSYQGVHTVNATAPCIQTEFDVFGNAVPQQFFVTSVISTMDEPT